MARRHMALVALMSAGLLAACGGGGAAIGVSPTLPPSCATGNGIGGHATTASYVIQVDVGSVETMYTPAQVASQHPTSGEVMLRGQMAGMAGNHLEVHICAKATGMVLPDVNPTITLINHTAGNVSQNVPIAVMQGVTSDASDVHYGNNVALTPGASYTVVVTLGGETATVTFQAPAQAPGATATTIAGSPPTTMAGMAGM